MGRPLKKIYLGNTSTGVGQQLAPVAAMIPGTYYNGAISTDAYFVKQVGTGRYLTSSLSGDKAGAAYGVTSLVNGPVTQVGQANLTVTTYSGGTEYARVIFDDTVKTWQFNDYTWYVTGVTLTAPGQATMRTL